MLQSPTGVASYDNAFTHQLIIAQSSVCIHWIVFRGFVYTSQLFWLLLAPNTSLQNVLYDNIHIYVLKIIIAGIVFTSEQSNWIA